MVVYVVYLVLDKNSDNSAMNTVGIVELVAFFGKVCGRVHRVLSPANEIIPVGLRKSRLSSGMMTRSKDFVALCLVFVVFA